jgi:hypothetical protein
MTKVGGLIATLETYEHHYGFDHPVIFKLGDKTLQLKDICNIEGYPENGTIIELEKKE